MLVLPHVLVVGSVWFYVFLLAMFIAVTALTECQRAFSAFMTVLAGLLALQFFGNADIFGYIWHNPLIVFGYVAIYFGGGVVYSLWRWRLYCLNQRDSYDDAKEAWLEKQKSEDTKRVRPDLVDKWEQYLREKSADRWSSTGYLPGLEMTIDEIKDNKGPRFRNHKNRCLTWMTYWPFSFFWTLLNDPMRKLFQHAISLLKGVYESIAANSWKGVSDDFQRPDSALADDGLTRRVSATGTCYRNPNLSLNDLGESPKSD